MNNKIHFKLQLAKYCHLFISIESIHFKLDHIKCQKRFWKYMECTEQNARQYGKGGLCSSLTLRYV